MSKKNVWRKLRNGVEVRRETCFFSARENGKRVPTGDDVLWFRTPRVNGVRRVAYVYSGLQLGLGIYWPANADRNNPIAAAHALRAKLTQ